MNDRVLQQETFPALMRALKAKGEVYVDFGFCSQFSHFLKIHDYELWMVTEQEPGITEDDRARFYTRR